MKPASLLISGLAGLALILFTACGGAAPAATSTSGAADAPIPTSVPDPATTAAVAPTAPPNGNGGSDVDGQALFASGACAACHTIEGVTEGLVGPDLTHIGTDAATLIQEVANPMRYRQSADAITQTIYVHPALPEVIQRAFGELDV